MLEILSNTDKSVDELLEGINHYYSTEEIKVPSMDTDKFNVINRVKEYADKNNLKYIDIDGVRIMYEDGWALVRASNTGPNLTLRFEATSKRGLTLIKKEFMDLLNVVINKK
jgi:phosphomannomutase/phosphoglucomutase